jgi:short-subunit dehydrogenase
MKTMQQNGFTGKNVLITGASSGIGAALARKIQPLCAQLIITGRSVDKLEANAAMLGSNVRVASMDVTDQTDVDQTIAWMVEKYGNVDILINNAGFGKFANVTEMDVSMYEQMMNVNYFGTVRCTMAVLPKMMQVKSGHIINIISVAGKWATAKSAGYSATKHATLAFTNALRQELYQSGVLVTAVHPGPVDTPFFDVADPSGDYVRKVNKYMVTADQVAQSVVHGVEQRKPEIFIPTWMGWGTKLSQIVPISLMNKISVKFLSIK